MSSTTARNSIFEVILARYTAALETGASRTPSRQPFSTSLAKERLRPSSEVNTIIAHSRPDATDRTSKASPVWDIVAP